MAGWPVVQKAFLCHDVILACLKVNNLPEPHGECNETASLPYHDEYYMAACVVECEEMYLLEICGCRDVYMPHSPGGKSATVKIREYVHCFLCA